MTNAQLTMPANGSPAAVEKKIAPLAYAAFFASVPILLMPFLFPVPLVLGILALRSIRNNPQYVGRGRAIFGIAWGILGSLLLAFVLLITLMQR